MGGGKPKKVTIPAESPVSSPVPVDVEVLEKERARRAQRLRKFGRGGTILTMGGLGSSEAEEKRGTLLGGSA